MFRIISTYFSISCLVLPLVCLKDVLAAPTDDVTFKIGDDIVTDSRFIREASLIKNDGANPEALVKCRQLLQLTRRSNKPSLATSSKSYQATTPEWLGKLDDLLILSQLHSKLIRKVDQMKSKGISGLFKLFDKSQKFDSSPNRNKVPTETDLFQLAEEFAGYCRTVWTINLSSKQTKKFEQFTELVNNADLLGEIQSLAALKVQQIIELRRKIIESLENRIGREILQSSGQIEKIESKKTRSIGSPDRLANLKGRYISVIQSHITKLQNDYEKLRIDYDAIDQLGARIMRTIIESEKLTN